MMADNGHVYESQGTFPKEDFVSSLDYGRSRVADRADFGGGGGHGETRGVLLDAFSAPPNTYLEHGCFNHPSDVKLPGDSFLEPWMARLAESQLQPRRLKAPFVTGSNIPFFPNKLSSLPNQQSF